MSFFIVSATKLFFHCLMPVGETVTRAGMINTPFLPADYALFSLVHGRDALFQEVELARKYYCWER